MIDVDSNVDSRTDDGRQIRGYVAPGFEPILEEFVANFDHRGELGGGVAVYQEGELRVDLWGGVRRKDPAAPWERETRTMVFSSSKGVLSLMAAMLVHEGKLDLDVPVAQYWPEFGANGKQDVPVRMLLSHQAGLVYLVPALSATEILTTRRPVEVLQEQAPLWTPGSWGLYHAHTFGWLIAEVVRRITDERHDDFLRNRIATPLSLDCAFGIPDSDMPRVAHIEPPMESADKEAQRQWEQVFFEDPWWRRLLTLDDALPFPGFDGDDTHGTFYNAPEVLAAGMPATGLITTAGDLARMYGAAVSEVDGTRLTSDEVLRDMSRYQTGASRFPDSPNDPRRRWGSGFLIPGLDGSWPMLGDGSFGHDGAGGSIGFGDIDHQIGFGYVTNQMGGIPDDRGDALSRALQLVIR